MKELVEKIRDVCLESTISNEDKAGVMAVMLGTFLKTICEPEMETTSYQRLVTEIIKAVAQGAGFETTCRMPDAEVESSSSSTEVN